MSIESFVVAPQNYPRPLAVVGEHITVLASGVETGGYEIFLQSGLEGSGPPPHTHPWDESFYVLTGEIEFGIGEDICAACPGMLVHLPAETRHWFRFGKGGGKMISMTSRAGAARMFAEIDRDIAADQPDLHKLVEIAGRHSVTIAA